MVVGQPVWSSACAINKGGLPTSIDPPEFTEAMLVELDKQQFQSPTYSQFCLNAY